MKRPNFITQAEVTRTTNLAGRTRHPKQPKRFHYPERSKKILTEVKKELTLV